MKIDHIDTGYAMSDEKKVAKELIAIWDRQFQSLTSQDFTNPAFIDHLKAIAVLHEALKRLVGKE